MDTSSAFSEMCPMKKRSNLLGRHKSQSLSSPSQTHNEHMKGANKAFKQGALIVKAFMRLMLSKGI